MINMPKKTRNPPILEILDNLPVLVDAFDSENKIVFWNKKCEELIGYSKEEIIQHENPLSLLYPKKGYLEYMMEKIKKNEEAKSLEWEITCKNGDKRNILWSHFYMYSSLLDADVWAIGIDVTARHQISKKLRESEQKYRSLMENSPVGCFIVQEDQIKYANKVMADILGYSVEEILTWNMEKANEHIHPEDLKELWEDKDEFPNKEFRIISKNKEIKWIAQFSHEIPFQGKRANQIILIDVTDQKKTKKKLFDMKLKEQKINSLATLAGGIAHDFNNILVSILGNINLVQMDFPSNQVDLFVKEKDQLDVGEYREIWEDRILDLQDNLETMESAVRRAKGLTQQLLTFSKGGKPVKKVKSIMNVINKTLVLIGHGFNAEVKV